MTNNTPIGYIWQNEIPLYQKKFPEILWKPAMTTNDASELIKSEFKKESSNIALLPIPIDSILHLSLRGWLQPVDQFFSKKELDRYLPLALNLLMQDGRLFGIPEDLNVYGFCFNYKHKMSKGMKEPTTWPELFEALAILKNKQIDKTLHISLNRRFDNQAFIWSLFHSNGVESRTFDNELQYYKKNIIEIYDFMKRLIQYKNVIPERSLHEYFKASLQERKNIDPIFYMGWIKHIPNSMRHPSCTKLMAFPSGNSGGHAAFPINGTAWAIPTKSKHHDIAVRTLRSMHETKFAKANELKGNVALPVLKEFWTDKDILDKHPLLKNTSVLFENDTKITGNCWISNIINLDYSLRNGLLENISDQQWYSRLINRINNDHLKLKNTTIQKTILFIDQNIKTLSSLNEIAKQVSISTNHLNRLFKTELGCTCWEYVIQLKSEKAKELIASTSLSMKEISAQLGFRDATSFSRTFQKKFGVSPSWYRKHPIYKYGQ